MKRVTAFNENILLSNVGGEIYATQNDCGHQRASLAKGKLEGSIVTCPLHGATFDVTTGRNVAGIQMHMSPELMQKMPPELVAMFQKTGELLADIDIRPLKTYKVEVKEGSIYLDRTVELVQ
jgi:nitrite reductase/ring-hydroxylating ferredoxin subunit